MSNRDTGRGRGEEPEDRDHDENERQEAARPQREVDAESPLQLYKPGQGTIVRWGSAAGIGVLALAGANFLFNELGRLGVFQRNLTLHYLVPVGFLVAMGLALLWLLGRNQRVVDFLIATEGEMRKVNWSTTREVVGATQVVILTMLAMGFLLFVVDIAFMWLFTFIRVLRIGLFSEGGA